ncbi:MAG: RNA 2'-phosphotransferase [Thermoplasmata archaeon]|jgi:putative RNA 2'-phosphotransferase
MKIKSCIKHGPFRGEKCPVCGDNGKLILNDWEVEALSRIITGILRHFPENFNVRLDQNGWAKINDIVEGIKRKDRKFRWLKPYHIEAFILTDPKGRFQYDKINGKVRATYGHSINVDLSDLPSDNIPERLYYAIVPEEEEFINEIGIKPGERKWVHLSGTYEEAYIAGRHRSDNPIVLEINAKKLIDDGKPIFKANDKIYITKEIPPGYFEKPEQKEVEIPEEELKSIEEEKRKRREKERRKMEDDIGMK